jgi:hypothetical protein
MTPKPSNLPGAKYRHLHRQNSVSKKRGEQESFIHWLYKTSQTGDKLNNRQMD